MKSKLNPAEFQAAADNIVYITFINIANFATADEQIVLYNFDKEDKEHLFFLRAAMAVRDITSKPLYITGPWSLKHWIKKNYPSVKWTNKFNGNVDVPFVLNYERDFATEALSGGDFADIYEEFYERKD